MKFRIFKYMCLAVLIFIAGEAITEGAMLVENVSILPGQLNKVFYNEKVLENKDILMPQPENIFTGVREILNYRKKFRFVERLV